MGPKKFNSIENQNTLETQILIVEDHPLYATGMRDLVEFVVADTKITHVASLREACEFLTHTQPALIIADLQLTDSKGIQTAITIRKMNFETPILFMSGDESLLHKLTELALFKCFAMPKTGDFYQTSQMLTDCISRASIVASWKQPINNSSRFRSHLRRDISGRIQLTIKQREVMQLLLTGLSNKEIARELDLSPETIKTHLREIFTRMNVRNRTQAVSLFKKFPNLADLGTQNEQTN